MLVKGYSDFKLAMPGPLHGLPIYTANIKLDADVSQLFPYINAEIKDAIYYDRPHSIQFRIQGKKCHLYPDHAALAIFNDKDEAR